MGNSFFDPLALYWLCTFVLVYTFSHLLVSRHSRFSEVNDAQKKLLIKLFAIGTFTAIYLLFKMFGGDLLSSPLNPAK